MDNYHKEALNQFFVYTFNKILAWEEQALVKSACYNLSVKEMHILEAVAELEKNNQNTMSLIACRLSVSVGALTTAVNVLVNKGYLKRQRTANDRRIVLISLTEQGKSAELEHQQFHKEMVESVGSFLPEKDLQTLIVSLKALSDFFENKIKDGKKKQ